MNLKAMDRYGTALVPTVATYLLETVPYLQGGTGTYLPVFIKSTRFLWNRRMYP